MGIEILKPDTTPSTPVLERDRTQKRRGMILSDFPEESLVTRETRPNPSGVLAQEGVLESDHISSKSAYLSRLAPMRSTIGQLVFPLKVLDQTLTTATLSCFT